MEPPKVPWLDYMSLQESEEGWSQVLCTMHAGVVSRGPESGPCETNAGWRLPALC